MEEVDAKNLISLPTTPVSVADDEPFLVKPDQLKPTPNVRKLWFKQFPPPYAILIISVIQSIFYCSVNDRVYKLLCYDPNRQREVWRFVTYMFLHSTLGHLLLNVVVQCCFSYLLEKYQKSYRVILLYFGGGIIGALGASCFRPDLVVGSSAGVYALLISHISHIVLNYNSAKNKAGALVTVFTIVASDVIYNVVHVHYHGEPIISEGAHVGGAISGLILGFLLYTSKDKVAKTRNRIIFWVAFIIFVFLLVCLLVLTFQIKRCTPDNQIRIRYIYLC